MPAIIEPKIEPKNEPKNIENIGSDLKKSGVSLHDESPAPKNLNVFASATTFGLGLGVGHRIGENFNVSGSVHTGLLTDTQLMARADWEPMQSKIDNDVVKNSIGELKARAGLFGAVAYGDRVSISNNTYWNTTSINKGFAPIAGVTASVEHVKSGIGVRADFGVPLVSPRHSTDYYTGVAVTKSFKSLF